MKRLTNIAALGVVSGVVWMAGCEMPAVSYVPAVASADSTLDAHALGGSWVHRDESEGRVLVARIAAWDERAALCVLEGDLFTGEMDSMVMLKVWGYTEEDRNYVSAGWLFFPAEEDEDWGIDEEDEAEIGLSREEIVRRMEKVKREEGTNVFYTGVIELGEDSMVVRTIGPTGDNEIELDDPQVPIDSEKLRAWVAANAERAGEEPYGVTLRFTRVTDDEAEDCLRDSSV